MFRHRVPVQFTYDVVASERSVFFQDCPELTTHLTRVPRDLADDVAFEIWIVARSIERDSHAAARSLGSDDPR